MDQLSYGGLVTSFLLLLFAIIMLTFFVTFYPRPLKRYIKILLFSVWSILVILLIFTITEINYIKSQIYVEIKDKTGASTIVIDNSDLLAKNKKMYNFNYRGIELKYFYYNKDTIVYERWSF